MGLPQVAEARLFCRAGKQRFEDAQLLLREERTTGGVYLAGYTVECRLKALILASVATHLRHRLLREFHGNRGHSMEWLEWLGGLYRRHVRSSVPRDITRHLSRLAAWSTDLRYTTGLIRRREADEFIESVVTVATWADGRM